MTDKLAIVIEGTIRPTFFGKSFNLIIYQNKYGGWEIRDHPTTFRDVEIDSIVDIPVQKARERAFEEECRKRREE